MKLRVYAGFTTAELDAMSDEEWKLQLCHLARLRQAEREEQAQNGIQLKL